MTPRPRARSRPIVLAAILAVLVLLVGYVLGTQLAAPPSTAASLNRQSPLTPPAVKLAWPSFGAAAVGTVGRRGTLAMKGSDASAPIASITKTITALVVLQAKPLTSATDTGPSITFTDADERIFQHVQAIGGSWATVTPGSVMSERQALEAMLLPSANNYAISLANWAYGSETAYVTAANAWLASHGLDGTHVADASGLSEHSVSTPTDLVEIAKLVMANPALPSIVATTTATLPGAGEQTNRNRLLGTLGIDGIKTGNTSAAGDCLMFASALTLHGHRVQLVGVVIGAPDRASLFRSVKALVKSARAGFRAVRVARSGESFGRYSTVWGASARLVATRDAWLVVWSDTPITVSVHASPMRTGDAGEEAGTAVFRVGSTTVRRTLALAGDLPGPGPLWRIGHPAELG